jgi:hypothetical protein
VENRQKEVGEQVEKQQQQRSESYAGKNSAPGSLALRCRGATSAAKRGLTRGRAG